MGVFSGPAALAIASAQAAAASSATVAATGAGTVAAGAATSAAGAAALGAGTTAAGGLTLGQAALIAGGTSLITAGTSAYAAREQNKALEKAMDSEAAAAGVAQQQLAMQTGQQQEARIREANQLAARIRVARGEAGVGTGGSTAAVLRQVDTDAARDLDTLDTNYLFGVKRVRSGAAAQLDQLEAQTTNPLVAAFLGGLQGGTAGLQIAGGLEQLRNRE